MQQDQHTPQLCSGPSTCPVLHPYPGMYSITHCQPSTHPLLHPNPGMCPVQHPHPSTAHHIASLSQNTSHAAPPWQHTPGPAGAGSPAAPCQRWSRSTARPSSSPPGLGTYIRYLSQGQYNPMGWPPRGPAHPSTKDTAPMGLDAPPSGYRSPQPAAHTAPCQRNRGLRGMKEPQGILVAHVGPLAQQGVDVRQAGPLPAGCTGQQHGQRAGCRVAVVALLPQPFAVCICQPAAAASK